MRVDPVRVPDPMTDGGSIRFRRGVPEDVESVGPLWQAAFNIPGQWVRSLPQRFRPERILVAEEGSRIVATAQAIPTNQWFGGRPVSMAGIASVATDPLYRGTGVGPRLLERLLVESREAGFAIASLYPSTVPFYRRLGFEFAGAFTVYRVRLDDLPPARSGWGEASDLVAMPDDHDPLRASFRRLAERENGLVEGLDEDWWRLRVFGRHSEDEPGGTVCTAEDVPEGYAAYHQEGMGETVEGGYRLACTHLVAHTRRAAASLLGFFRRFKGVGKELQWQGPPTEPLAFIVAEQSIRFTRTWRFMTRLLDVQAALEARGYPDGVEGVVELGVDDPMIPSNTGTYRLEAGEGKVRATRIDDPVPRGRTLSMGALSTLYSGYVTPATAAAAGLVDPGFEGLDLLGRLFVGPSPWSADFF